MLRGTVEAGGPISRVMNLGPPRQTAMVSTSRNRMATNDVPQPVDQLCDATAAVVRDACTCRSTQLYVFFNPSKRGRDGFQPSFSAIRRLSEFCPNAQRTWDVPDRNPLAGDLHDHFGELIDRHHLFGADIDRASEIRTDQAPHGFNALVDVQERAGLLAVPPNFDFTTVFGFGDFGAKGGGSLFFPPVQVPSGPKML